MGLLLLPSLAQSIQPSKEAASDFSPGTSQAHGTPIPRSTVDQGPAAASGVCASPPSLPIGFRFPLAERTGKFLSVSQEVLYSNPKLPRARFLQQEIIKKKALFASQEGAIIKSSNHSLAGLLTTTCSNAPTVSPSSRFHLRQEMLLCTQQQHAEQVRGSSTLRKEPCRPTATIMHSTHMCWGHR